MHDSEILAQSSIQRIYLIYTLLMQSDTVLTDRLHKAFY